MRNKLTKIALTATFGLAMAFTLSCSDDKDESGDGNNTNGNGNGSEISFNENSQVYGFTSNGVIEVYDGGIGCGGGSDGSNGCDWNGLMAGSVTNGIVNLNLPTNIPSTFLVDFIPDNGQRFCSSYPQDLKVFQGYFLLTDSNRDLLGTLKIGNQFGEGISYGYFTKAGEITCRFEGEEEVEIININAQAGWNKIAFHRQGKTFELSTNNILTKEVKWGYEAYSW